MATIADRIQKMLNTETAAPSTPLKLPMKFKGVDGLNVIVSDSSDGGFDSLSAKMKKALLTKLRDLAIDLTDEDEIHDAGTGLAVITSAKDNYAIVEVRGKDSPRDGGKSFALEGSTYKLTLNGTTWKVSKVPGAKKAPELRQGSRTSSKTTSSKKQDATSKVNPVGAAMAPKKLTGATSAELLSYFTKLGFSGVLAKTLASETYRKITKLSSKRGIKRRPTVYKGK